MEEVLLMDLIVNKEIIPHNVSHAFLASGLLIALALVVRGSIQLIPRGIQNFMEVMIEAIWKLVDENIGHHWSRQLFPFIMTIFIFILICNFMSLVPGFAGATANVNTNAAMAIPVFLATHFYGIRVHGASYINHFLGPIRSLAALPLMILMFFVEVIGHIARPLTLTVRLFGNMTGKHIILIVLGIIAPILAPAVILCLGVLVSVVQAFVFALLATLYLAGAVEHAH
ncbi:MAG: F0F1 ATP synthase subunit A [Nitrospirae bacterium]|jgi:F-type H+-transporting ATPase subunit a|nr:F0F1 ATP synthase subunit A [Nitrospirota bacterium]